MSATRANPCCSQQEKLILNFRGRFWHIGFLRKNLAIALEYGVESNASLAQTPAKWLHITFLTLLPQDSLVVRPTSTKPRITSLTSSSWTQWSWMFCRVETWAEPIEKASDRLAIFSI